LSVGSDGWIIESPHPVHFRDFSIQQAHPDPARDGNAWLFFNHANVPEEYRLILIVWLVAAFIPGMPFPAMLISGEAGAGKSFICAFLKRIIDPSVSALQDNPKKDEDFDLLLFKHYCLAIDNLSNLSVSRADRICSVITGSTVEKRVLHTDIDTIVLPCNPRIILNGINSISNRSDLLDRSITVRLKRISENARAEEAVINELFDKDLPYILGGIADILSKAMAIHPTVKLSKYPRMADFCRWGYAIAEALGGRGQEFLKAYAGNAAKLGEGLLESDSFMSGLVQMMDSDNPKVQGTFKEVVDRLHALVQPDHNDYSFPSTRSFRNKLERYSGPHILDNSLRW